MKQPEQDLSVDLGKELANRLVDKLVNTYRYLTYWKVFIY